MSTLVEQNKAAVAELCRRLKVRRLDLFGSAAQGSFDPRTSDLDFLVAFATEDPSEYKRCYFALAEALERLFRRPVDLLTERAVRNPYFQQAIERSRQPVYAA